MNSNQTDMIFHTQGGRIALSLLRRLAEASMVHGDGSLRLGGRQEVILGGVPREACELVRRTIGSRLVEHHPRHPNIVTTRAICARSNRTPWLSEGTYEGILQGFQSAPGIAVDIVDPRQTRVPLFTGDIHFVATPTPDYWLLYLNHGADRVRSSLTVALHSDDIPAVAALVQHRTQRGEALDLPALQRDLETRLQGRTTKVGHEALAYPTTITPLSGFELDGKRDCYSLGIAVQTCPLPGAFLVDLAMLAERHQLANAHITPCKGLLIHGIPRAARPYFERLLLKHRINLHPGAWDHVCLDGWLRPELDGCARALLRTLNEQVPHAGALSLALVAGKGAMPDTPIIIRAELPKNRWSLFSRRPRFSLFARENFERNNSKIVAYGQCIPAPALADHVIALIDCYGTARDDVAAASSPPIPVMPRLSAHRCMTCETEYDERYGDPLGDIPPGTPFLDLPEDWSCPTCGAPAEDYKSVRGTAA